MIDIIRAGALSGFCQLTRLLGADPDPLLARVRLCESDLDDPDRYLRRADVIELLEISARQLGCADIGLRLSEVQDINILGALAFAVRNAETLRDAFATASRYVHYHAPTGSLWLELGEDPFEERVCFVHGHAQVEREVQMVEHTIGVFCRINRHLTDGKVEPRRIVFPHARVSQAATYLKHLGLKPHFDSGGACSVTFARSDLDFPLRTANRPLQVMVEQYLQTHAPPPSPHIEMRTQQVMTRLMRSTGRVVIDDIAAMLRVHRRTLQRSLKANGTTFEQVRDNVRRNLAEIYLANDVIPIAHVADLVGYSNQSALTRSCLRWFGKTPLVLRQELCWRVWKAQEDKGVGYTHTGHSG